VFAPLVALLDRRAFGEFSVFDRDMFVDRSADGLHPGPDSSRIIADRVFQQSECRQRAVNATRLAVPSDA
jgi:hypothetical protein